MSTMLSSMDRFCRWKEIKRGGIGGGGIDMENETQHAIAIDKVHDIFCSTQETFILHVHVHVHVAIQLSH